MPSAAFFEPTSVSKSTSILRALHDRIDDGHFHSTPVTFVSPNQFELSQLFQAVRSSSFDLSSKPYWWSIMDDLSLGETYHSDLTLLSKHAVTLSQSNLFKDGLPHMAISLVPFFQHLFIKCGENGQFWDKVTDGQLTEVPGVFVAMRVVDETTLDHWSLERTRPDKHQLVAKGKNSVLVLKHYPAIPIKREQIVNVTGAGDSFVGSLLTAIANGHALDTPQNLDEAVTRAQTAASLSLSSAHAVSPLISGTVLQSV